VHDSYRTSAARAPSAQSEAPAGRAVLVYRAVSRGTLRHSPRTPATCKRPLHRSADCSTVDGAISGDRQYLEDGCDGPGWYIYVLGRLTLKIDNVPIASDWLPMLEAARLGVRGQG
jgi:hypothetical protein